MQMHTALAVFVACCAWLFSPAYLASIRSSASISAIERVCCTYLKSPVKVAYVVREEEFLCKPIFV
jgi:hypothetical protein